ncbi:MAG: beta-galactosidase [Verrucomicrobia bacterium]|nr:beta-galactosidase [Verrucomicrobiota bacterium]
MRKPIAVLKDVLIAPFATFDADDALSILDKSARPAKTVRLDDLLHLTRTDTDILVLPYVQGTFPEKHMRALVDFHAEGGSLLFLGDTPHVRRWFPYRNSLAPKLHLTRCTDHFELRGLSEKGREILGDLPGLDELRGRMMAGVRTSAYPPDICHGLLKCGGHFRDVSPVVLVERRCQQFLGSKLSVVGFDGGEPRENVLGVCDLPYTFDPGLLDRRWSGATQMLLRLIDALEPRPFAATLDLEPLAASGTETVAHVRLRNFGFSPRTVQYSLRNIATGKVLCDASVDVGAGTACASSEIRWKAPVGPLKLELEVHHEDELLCRQRFIQHTYAPENHHELGFGFSTYWSFKTNTLDDEFCYFVEQMKQRGAQYVRFAINWEDTEKEPGVYDWSIADQLVDLAAGVGLRAFLWVFPTARGSGLGEAGVPEWALKEPAIDREGTPGNFPCIWSPFYRERYFGFLAKLTERYAEEKSVERFIYDFGNSDFPYCYHYYGGPGDVFDYSPHERTAFVDYLENTARIPLDRISRIWGSAFNSYNDVPVPFSENKDAWLIYDEFRRWGVHQGIKEAYSIVAQVAPDKLPPDLPGHGLGSIADLLTCSYEAQALHWEERKRWAPEQVEAHNAGKTWGGEPWQVGARFKDYDDALFQSVRLGASYFSIPGPDLGIWGEDIAKVAAIRRTLMGSERPHPRVAVIDRMAWNAKRSLAHVAARLDQPVHLLTKWNRHDFTCYDLMVLPGYEIAEGPGGVTCLLPDDDAYYVHLRDCVERGLRILVFPRTGTSGATGDMRAILGIDDVSYGPELERTVEYPQSFGGGSSNGHACTVNAEKGEVILTDTSGEPILVERSVGRGAILLAGSDNRSRGIDEACPPLECSTLAEHSLPRLLDHLRIAPPHIRTHQASVFKELVWVQDRDYILLYSHLNQPITLNLNFKPRTPPRGMLDIASGREYPFLPENDGWFHSELELPDHEGLYIALRAD